LEGYDEQSLTEIPMMFISIPDIAPVSLNLSPTRQSCIGDNEMPSRAKIIMLTFWVSIEQFFEII
jgi:hypothetical protein